MEEEYPTIVQPIVFILESPSDMDVFEDRAEGYALFSSLKLSRVPCHYVKIVSSEAFDRSFVEMYHASQPYTQMLNDVEVQVFPIPYIHISAHGTEDGIVLTNDDFLPWGALRDNLIALAHNLNMIDAEDSVCLLTLCMSACRGAHAREILNFGPPYGFQALVGSNEDVSWADALTAYVTFYHAAVYKGQPVFDAVARMNQAVGADSLFFVTTYLDA